MEHPGRVEIADIFRLYGDRYRREAGHVSSSELRVMRNIEDCRTAVLGGHEEKCSHCGRKRYSYNSCRNRHCPKCQLFKREKWIKNRKRDLLPIQYFHVVFTVPNLGILALANRKVIYNLMFQSVARTIRTSIAS